MTIPVPVNQDNAFQIGRTFTAPQELENAYISFMLDFTTNTQYQLDYATLDQPNIFGVAKSLYFDNLNNNQTVTVLVEGSNQRFQIPANSAGYYRINSPTKTRINFTTGAAQAVICNAAVYNFDVMPIIWYKTGISGNSVVWGPDDIGSAPTHPPVFVGGVDPTGNIIAVHLDASGKVQFTTTQLPATLGQKNEANSLSVTPSSSASGAGAVDGNTQRIVPASDSLTPIGKAYTDRSIANLSGVSEQLMPANANRRMLVVYNIGATSVGINLTGGAASLTAGGSVVLVAGGSMVLDTNPPVGAINIIGTLNADVTAYEA